MELKPYSTGISELLEKSRDITLIRVTSQTDSATIDSLASELFYSVGVLEEYIYTPPPRPKIKITRSGTRVFEQEEQIPKISNPKRTYVIVHDYLTTGWTLKNAVKMLKEQGVDEEKIWCLTYTAGEKRLDYAIKFLQASHAMA